MEKKQVAISPIEFVVRQILVWAVLNHPKADNFYRKAPEEAGVKQLFMVLDKTESRVVWNEQVVSSLPLEDLMGLFIGCERTPMESAPPTSSIVLN